MTLRDDVSQVQWWHQMELAPGVFTDGRQGYGTQETLRRIRLPQTLTGKTVLDVGSWDGFFAFESERRGATRVLATDSFVWEGRTWGSKAGFTLARTLLNSKVEDMVISPYDLSPERIGMWDIVLFLGVLYHLKHPLLALERLASVTRELLLVETHIDLSHGNAQPLLIHYPNAELDGDPTSWWGPNPICVQSMLASVGFAQVIPFDNVLPEPQKHQPFHKRWFFAASRFLGEPRFLTTMRTRLSKRTRMAFHALK